MEWNLKTPTWDLTEFDQETNLVSGSSGFVSQGIKEGFSVDLKLGQVVDLGSESSDNSKVQSVPKMAVSPSGSSKRARAVNNGVQIASCSVDGCNADLSNCREYHRRHKVCELHSKTPEVTINGGRKQRFCQQCSRFHSLEEFDDGKRSCRKRLDGHNRRRRKPQPEHPTRSESFLSNYQGGRLFPFSGPQVYPTTAVANPVWSGIVKAEQNNLYNQNQNVPRLDKQNPFSGSSSSSSYKGEERQFTFLHGTTLALGNQTVPEASICQPLLKTIASSESGRDMFCAGLSTQALNSDCALSLLSSPPSQTPAGIGLSHMLATDSIPLAHPLGMSTQYSSLEPMDTVLVSNASSNEVHCPGMFHTGPEAASDNESPQTLPFYWE